MSAGDREIAALAKRQHGVVSRRQLLALGLGRGAIANRVASGRLHPIHRGVYLVGHAVPPLRAPEMAAILACGDGSIVSHRSAAGVWGLVVGGSRAPVEVTVVRVRAPSRPGIRVHRARSLDARDVRRVERIPVTSPARTILDLAARTEALELERMIAEGIRRGLVRETERRELLGRSRGRRGAVALRHAVSGERGPAFTRSAAERMFLALVRAPGLPEPRVNAMVEGHEVDFLWPRHRLIVEIDGAAYHSDRAAFERDRLRDAELQAAGFRVIRVTWRQLTEDPRGTIGRLEKVLDCGGSPTGPAPC